MTTLSVSSGADTWTFEPSRVASIGRDPGCDITLSSPAVSRQHAQVRYDGTGWVLVDTGSSAGTWLNGVRVTEVRINARTVVRFGAPDGEEIVLAPAGAEQRPAAPNVAGIPPGLAQTVLPGTGPVGPGYASGPGILVRVGGASYRFGPGTVIRIGRDPSGEVVVDDPSVSRLHGVLEGRPEGWWYVDRSTAGSFRSGGRVTQQRLAEPTTLMLGHPTAGAEVEVVPIVAAQQAQKSISKRKRRKTAALVGGIVGALVLVGGGVTAAVLLGGDDDPPPQQTAQSGLSDANLARAKLATVQVIVVDQGGQRLGHGSGAIISEDGLVITNAHVADPNAPGLGSENDPDPAGLVIALPSDDDDEPAKPTYRAEVLVSDGVLDVSVLQITALVNGEEVAKEDLDLPEPLPLGDSDELRTDEEIRVLGFPALARFGVERDEQDEDDTLTVTRGVVSTFIREGGIDDPRGWIDTDARIAGGNSGGPSINEKGELIGLNTQALGDNIMGAAGATSGGSGRVRPIKLLADVIEIARKGGDTSYVSPFYTPPPPEPTESSDQATVGATGWSVDGNSDCSEPNLPSSPQSLAVELPGTLYAHFRTTNLPDGTPYEVRVETIDGVPVDTSSGAWSLGSGEVCASVTVDVPDGVSGMNVALVFGATVIENPVVFE